MDVKQAINERRSLRTLGDMEVTEDLINDLAESAQLAPSCYNNQPWRFVFIYQEGMREKIKNALAKGNSWAYDSPLMIAVFSKPDFDCQVKERDYYLFDTGMAVGLLMLRATELGLVTHAIAGFDEDKAKEILNIPEEMKLITFVFVGEKVDEIDPDLPDWATKAEKNRPERKKFEEYVYLNQYEEKE
jgi:nitroreductase